MNTRLILIIIVVSLAFHGCQSDGAGSGRDNNLTEDFFPIGNFIESQLRNLDTLPLAVIKYRTISGITDTTVVEKGEFRKLSEGFMAPDIASPELHNRYTETSFIDATLGTLTLTYTARDQDLLIRRADVLLNEEKGDVQSVYIEKAIEDKDSTVIEKILWTRDRNCQVSELHRYNNRPEQVVVTRYVWDDRE